MPKPTTAYLICIFAYDGELLKRRIALNWIDADDFIRAYAEKLGATIVEDSHGCSGKIVGKVVYTYDIINIAVV